MLDDRRYLEIVPCAHCPHCDAGPPSSEGEEGFCEQCGHCRREAEAATFEVGTLCCTRVEYGKTGVANRWYIVISGRDRGHRWWPPYLNAVEAHSAVEVWGWPDFQAMTLDVVRRFTREQWEALRAAGWPVDYLECFRTAGVDPAEPVFGDK
jgi:hypothetical protein